MSNTELATYQTEVSLAPREEFSFGQYLEAAKFLAASDMIPKQFQGKPANILIALNLAHRLKADVFHVMQSIYIVSGRPSFSGQFYIACVNTSGRFAPISYEEKKDQEGKVVACRVVTTDLRTQSRLEGPWVSLDMANSEGWLKNNPKWRSMPELMLRYRAAAFFVRSYCPDVTMGVLAEGEAEDIPPQQTINVSPLDPRTAMAPKYEPTPRVKNYITLIESAPSIADLNETAEGLKTDESLKEADRAYLRPLFAKKKAEFEK